jgi:hypothetical protein
MPSSSNIKPDRIILTATIASASLAGFLSSISLLAIPALSTSPSVEIIIQQFKTLYRVERLIRTPFTLFTSALWFVAAWRAYFYGSSGSAGVGGIKGPWKSLTLAGTFLVGMLGLTQLVVEPVSRALVDGMHYHERDLERNDGVEEGELLGRWGRLNWGRVGLVGGTVAVGVRALLL